VQKDLDLVGGVARQIKGQAEATGFAPITHAAGRLADAAADASEPAEVSGPLDQLVRLCRAAVPVPPRKP